MNDIQNIEVLFLICDTMRHDLPWSHYHLLISMEEVAPRLKKSANTYWS